MQTNFNILHKWVAIFVNQCSRFPYSLVALLARFMIALVFWRSGQTKVAGFAIDLINGGFTLGIPHITPGTIELFASEYKLPLIPPEPAAIMAALGEHIFSVMLLFGLGTRFAASGLLVMTLTIQIFVYPDAYPTHGLWASILLFLIVKGPGAISIDHLIARRYRYYK